MNELTEFQAQAANMALKKTLSGRHFSICDFDALAKSIGVQVGGPDYNALRNLHCVDWAEMSPPMRQMAQEKIVELLGLPPMVMEMEKSEPEPKHQPEQPRMKLAFWR
jgi:hypothetical protein